MNVVQPGGIRLRESVRFEQTGLSIGEKYTPLVCAQFEFWRMNPLFWEEILDRIVDVGFQMVGAFLCWDFHEIAPGEYDFEGQTNQSRDVLRWLELCQERNLRVLLRPGPIIDDEWPTRGPPVDVATLERTDPRFRERALEWIEAVAEMARPWLATSGGPITVFHVDNEVFYPHVTEVVAPEPDREMHVEYIPEMVVATYRQWLEEQTDRTTVDDSLAPLLTSLEPHVPDYTRPALAESLLSLEFVSDIVDEYQRWLRDEWAKRGIDIPIVCNIKGFLAYLDWPKFETSLGPIGHNNYFYRLETQDQISVALWWTRLQRARSSLSWATEYGTGKYVETNQNTSDLLPENSEYILRANLAMGVRGFNFYNFVDRDDWHYAPISPLGKVRQPIVEPFLRMVPLIQELRPDRLVSGVGIVWSIWHHRAFVSSLFRDWSEIAAISWQEQSPKESPAWWTAFCSLYEEDYDFEIIDLDRVAPDPDLTLVYAGPDFASRNLVERLLAFVQSGGRLVVATHVPTRDLRGREQSVGQELEEKVDASERCIKCPPEKIDAALRILGATRYVRASSRGPITTAYESEGEVWVFVWNSRPESWSGNVELGSVLASDADYEVIRPFDGSIPRRGRGADLLVLPVTVAGHSVEILRLRSLTPRTSSK